MATIESDPPPTPGQPRKRRVTATPGGAWDSARVRPPEIPIGYAALLPALGITTYVPVHQSALAQNAATRGGKVETDALGRERRVFPGTTAARHATVTDHLLTALKYDGVDLEALRLVFDKIHVPDLTDALAQSPLATASRQAWFLYEWITGKTLDLPGGVRTAYVPLLDPKRYVTCEQGRSSRHGVMVNCLGTTALCPTIRRSADWEAAISSDPLGRRDRLAATLDASTEERINSFLVTRESHSTYAIEGESTTPKSDAIFYALLKEWTAADHGPLTHHALHHLQRTLLQGAIGKELGQYRSHQIWVGDRSFERAIPTHIAPQAKDVPEFMDHFCALANTIGQSSRQNIVHPIAAAAVTSGLLAYIHPFDDGNGRVGRLLLQQPLTTTSPTGHHLFVPISAAINRNRKAYYASLDAWSKPLLERISFDHIDGGVRVSGETKSLYRFPDLTRYAAFIAGACVEAVTKDLQEERYILKIYDLVQPALAAAGLDEQKATLFFSVAQQNDWKLSKRKARFFPHLTEDIIQQLEDKLSAAARKVRG